MHNYGSCQYIAIYTSVTFPNGNKKGGVMLRCKVCMYYTRLQPSEKPLTTTLVLMLAKLLALHNSFSLLT